MSLMGPLASTPSSPTLSVLIEQWVKVCGGQPSRLPRPASHQEQLIGCPWAARPDARAASKQACGLHAQKSECDSSAERDPGSHQVASD
jgi:hypothetical protein